MISSILTPVTTFFINNFNYFFLSVLILAAVYCFLKYDVLKLNGLSADFEYIGRELNSIKVDGMGTIEDINSLFAKKERSAAGRIWTGYYSDWQGIVQNQNSLRISDYFNMMALLSIPASRKRAEAVPGLLIALGILGTLTGLVLGIRNMGVPGGENGFSILSDSLVSSLGLLITAVLLSVLYQLADRWIYQKAICKTQAFLVILERKIPKASTTGYFESMLKKQQLQINRMQEMMENTFDKFTRLISEQLAGTLSMTLEASVSCLIAPSVDSIRDSVNQLSQITLENQTDVIQKIIDNFVSNMGQALDGQLGTLGRNIGEAAGCLQAAKENLEFLIRELVRNAGSQREINAASGKVMEAMVRCQDDMAKSSARLTETFENTNRFAAVLTEMLEADQAVTDKLNEQQQLLAQENKNYFDNMNNMMVKMQEDLDLRIDDILARFTDITQESLGRMESSMSSTLEGLTSSSGTMIENLDMQVRNMGSYTREMIDELDELNGNLKDAVREFSEQLNFGVEKTFGEFDQGLGEISIRLSETVSKIRDSIDDLPLVVEEAAGKIAAARENEL